MKKAIVALAGIAFLTGIYSFAPGTGKKALAPLTVNTAKSRVDWVASKKNDFHTGFFPIKSGEVNVDGGKLTGGKFVIDLANLKVTDAGGGDGLTGHLKRADFFDVEKFAEATYDITSVSYTGENTAEVSGNLTVKGTIVPMKIQVLIRNSDDKGFFAQSFVSIDRTLLGVNYGIGNVSKDVELAIHIFAK
ncbi:MAG: YceI family protein [Bacteroidota bacterium]